MALRHKSKRKCLFRLDELTDESDGQLLVEEVIRTEERNRILHFCMGEMNPDYREVLYLTYFEGMSCLLYTSREERLRHRRKHRVAEAFLCHFTEVLSLIHI